MGGDGFVAQVPLQCVLDRAPAHGLAFLSAYESRAAGYRLRLNLAAYSQVRHRHRLLGRRLVKWLEVGRNGMTLCLM